MDCSYESFRERSESKSSSSHSSTSTSKSPSPVQTSGVQVVEKRVSATRLEGILQEETIISSTSPHITAVSHQTYGVWKDLEVHFASELAPFWIQTSNKKEDLSSKIFIMEVNQGNSDDEWEVDNTSIELETYTPKPLSEEEEKAGFRIVEPSPDRAKKYFIAKLEKICGKKVVSIVYPEEERSGPLTAEKAEKIFNFLILLRNRAEKNCEGNLSKFDICLSLEMDRLASDLKEGKVWQEMLQERFSPKK